MGNTAQYFNQLTNKSFNYLVKNYEYENEAVCSYFFESVKNVANAGFYKTMFKLVRDVGEPNYKFVDTNIYIKNTEVFVNFLKQKGFKVNLSESSTNSVSFVRYRIILSVEWILDANEKN